MYSVQHSNRIKDTIDQIDLTDIYRTFHTKTADYTFFSSVRSEEHTV